MSDKVKVKLRGNRYQRHPKPRYNPTTRAKPNNDQSADRHDVTNTAWISIARLAHTHPPERSGLVQRRTRRRLSTTNSFMGSTTSRTCSIASAVCECVVSRARNTRARRADRKNGDAARKEGGDEDVQTICFLSFILHRAPHHPRIDIPTDATPHTFQLSKAS